MKYGVITQTANQQPEKSGFFVGTPGGGGLSTGRWGAEKGAFFDFYGTITTTISY
ncbi:TPA: hypothetical protein KC759_004705 [Escherichia coli O146]|nr:hypothetical protein [Escherichia coli O146]HBC3162145.1 hypothetical protein [Escherichia coli O146]